MTAHPHIAARLPAVLLDGEPLHVLARVTAAGAKGISVVDLVAGARSAPLAGRRAGFSRWEARRSAAERGGWPARSAATTSITSAITDVRSGFIEQRLLFFRRGRAGTKSPVQDSYPKEPAAQEDAAHPADKFT